MGGSLPRLYLGLQELCFSFEHCALYHPFWAMGKPIAEGRKAMSEIPQRSKRVLPKRSQNCSKAKFASKNEALSNLRKMRDKGIRGAGGLKTEKCGVCSDKKADIFHISPRRAVT